MNRLPKLILNRGTLQKIINGKTLLFNPLNLPEKAKYIKVLLPKTVQEIVIGSKLKDWTMDEMVNRNYSSIVLFVDSTLIKIHSKFINWIIKALGISHIIPIDPQESSKDLEKLNGILDQCLRAKLDQKSCILAIGGGVVGDIAGFIASVYLKDIDFVFMPTTLMSQADSIINKVGISYKLLENVLNSFVSPSLTICDTDFLLTLPKSEISLGMSEVIKHALIDSEKSVDHLTRILKPNLNNWKNYPWTEIVFQSLHTKAKLITTDPYDIKGIQKGINYGHGFTKILEGASRFSLRHGETVSIGMMFAGKISHDLGLLTKRDLDIQRNLLEICNLPTQIPVPIDPKYAIDILFTYNISLEGKITLILLRRIGKYILYKNVDPQAIEHIFKNR